MNIPAAAILWGSIALAAPSRAEGQLVGSLADERARLAQITGDTSLAAARPDPVLGSWLTRLPRSLRDSVRMSVRFVRPDVRIVWNSDVPYSLNDGPMWAGRGVNLSVGAGVAVEAPYRSARLRVVVAPAVTYSRNLPFQILPNILPDRSSYANPLHVADEASLDLPMRFGDRPLLGFFPGRSSATVAWSRVVAGVTAENEWWGPAIRNALVMSGNAPGIPRWFVKTARPLTTPAGNIDAELISGVLTQSLFFSDTGAQTRTLSGMRVQLRTAFDSGLTLGMTRVVYRTIGPYASPFLATLSRAPDALIHWENLDGAYQQSSDQLTSLFARWAPAASGMEVYGEWARMALPCTLTEVLTTPHYTGAWTVGLQWASPQRVHRYVRVQTELSYLEQSRVFLDRPSPDFYAGLASPQGYTNRGQVIGAAIGPGSSSQWLALDLIEPRYQVGAFLGRVRWDNNALYRLPSQTFFSHDVSLLGGLRGAWRAPFTDLSAELTSAKRYNYLFQNGVAQPGGYRTVDVRNVTLALVATPR